MYSRPVTNVKKGVRSRVCFGLFKGTTDKFWYTYKKGSGKKTITMLERTQDRKSAEESRLRDDPYPGFRLEDRDG